jgi:hypothetical protein
MFTPSRMRTIAAGIAFWLAGTAVIRLFGQHLLRPGSVALVLYAASFAAMALVVPWLLHLLRAEPVEGVTLLALPTLLFDPFSCLFFASLFPNVAPAAAGIFGGWMLICCGGAVVGAWAKR